MQAQMKLLRFKHIYIDLRFGNPAGNEAAGVSRGVKSEKSDLTAPKK